MFNKPIVNEDVNEEYAEALEKFAGAARDLLDLVIRNFDDEQAIFVWREMLTKDANIVLTSTISDPLSVYGHLVYQNQELGDSMEIFRVTADMGIKTLEGLH